MGRLHQLAGVLIFQRELSPLFINECYFFFLWSEKISDLYVASGEITRFCTGMRIVSSLLGRSCRVIENPLKIHLNCRTELYSIDDCGINHFMSEQ